MMRIPSLLMSVFLGGSLILAQPASDTAALTQLLHEFLAGASRRDASVHERFWADELIYTTSSGERKGKARILAELRETRTPARGEAGTTYTAEEIQIQLHGETAVVAFRLVGTTREDGKTVVSRYLNTGTFVRREGRWQAVAWQATRIPEPETR